LTLLEGCQTFVREKNVQSQLKIEWVIEQVKNYKLLIGWCSVFSTLIGKHG
jgi:hypothetical protein